jgi:transcriptional regulator with GAF, ATPase, and Fis domain
VPRKSNAEIERDINVVLASKPRCSGVDTTDITATPLTEAKRRSAAEYERCYLSHVMEKARGSVSEGARIAGLDRTNFRRLLHRYGIHY